MTGALRTGLKQAMSATSWPALQEALMQATEEQCFAMLVEERAHRRNQLVLGRVFCRFNKLRGQRERRLIVGTAPLRLQLITDTK